MINASWDDKGNSKGVADFLGLMVYEGTLSLNYVKNYNNGLGQWSGFPIRVNAPNSAILLGAKGSARPDHIIKMARESIKQDLLGIMVWYASVKNGFQYAASWDATDSSKDGFVQAKIMFDEAMTAQG